MNRTTNRSVALSIAGSDSGGGAGIQADLRTFSATGVFGTTAITAVTAQNLDGVHEVVGLSPSMVEAQVAAVLDGFEVAAIKTGMLWSAEIVDRVASLLSRREHGPVVVDPVMVATSGDRLLQDDAVDVYRQQLFPVSTVITPNLDEAALLLGGQPIERSRMDQAAETLAAELGCAVLLKGGHLSGDPLDLLWQRGQITRWERPRISGTNTHGSGCMLSAALAAQLARGAGLVDACDRALRFVHEVLAAPHNLAGDVHLAGIERALRGDPLVS